MSFETDLAARMVAAPAVAALVGARCFHYDLPQGATLPALVFRRISTGFITTHSGLNALRVARVQFDCWARDEQQSLDLAAAVIAAMETFNLADEQSVPVAFPNVVINRFPMHEREPEPPYYRQIVETRIWFRE